MGHKFSAASDRIYLQNAFNDLVFDTNRKMPHILKKTSFNITVNFPAEANTGQSQGDYWLSNVNAMRHVSVLDSAVPTGANFALIRFDSSSYVSGSDLGFRDIFRDGFTFAGSVIFSNPDSHIRRLDAVIVGSQLQLQGWHGHSDTYNIPKVALPPVNGAVFSQSFQGQAYIGRVA